MSDAVVGLRLWPRGRLFGAVVLVFCAQLGLIFWLGSRTTPQPRQVTAAPALRLAGGASSELLALTDPTLFALPHQEGFSGPAWLKVSRLPVLGFVWTEDTNRPPPPAPPLGAAFGQFMATNHFDSLQMPNKPEPALALPGPLPMEMPTQSTLRLVGALSPRSLMTALKLPSWPPRTNSAQEPDLVTNSRVQVVVDTAGKPVSVALLSSSGSPAADKFALEAARSARFEPVSHGEPDTPANPLADLAWGQMIFEWHTLSESANDGPAGP
jgi:TonB family protein